VSVGCVAILGCGLMGGSLAMALRRAGAVSHLKGYSRSPASAQRAQALGIVDEACSTLAEAVQDADVVVLSVPVAATGPTLAALKPYLPPHTLLTDVGSTKRDVVAAARAALGERISAFVPAHPIAGKESAGIEHASADLYDSRRAILTPLPENLPDAIGRIERLWTVAGAKVHTMTPEAHDAAFAAVSHLPHLLAFAYLRGLASQGATASLSEWLSLAGPGFRDFSRIGGSDAAVWRDILSTNHDEVLRQLDAFSGALADFRTALTLAPADPSALETLIAAAAPLRAGWTLGGPKASVEPAAPASPAVAPD
jgi:prephenate dehydrogenase